jgi:hypothetical protein
MQRAPSGCQRRKHLVEEMARVVVDPDHADVGRLVGLKWDQQHVHHNMQITQRRSVPCTDFPSACQQISPRSKPQRGKIYPMATARGHYTEHRVPVNADAV